MTPLKHEDAWERLELAASGGLSAEEERALSTHLAVCDPCSRELEALQDLASELRRLPTPMPSAAIVEQVRRLVHLELAGEADERLSTLVVVFLLFFSWTVTWLSVAVARALSGGELGLGLLGLASGQGLGWSLGYLATAWLGGGVVVVLLALSFRKSRRFA